MVQVVRYVIRKRPDVPFMEGREMREIPQTEEEKELDKADLESKRKEGILVSTNRCNVATSGTERRI